MKLEIKKDDIVFTVMQRHNDTETFIVNRSAEWLPVWDEIVLRYNLHEELIEALNKTQSLLLDYMANQDSAPQQDYDYLDEVAVLLQKANNNTQIKD